MKYFVISDVHSYYKPMKKALQEAGYDYKNPEHFLIVCGDIFDRGSDTNKVYNFIKRVPKSRCALIRGNHEYLLKDALKELMTEDNGEFSWHHYSNGTVKSMFNLYNLDYSRFGADIFDLYNEEKANRRIQKIVKWMMSPRWKNYYEVGRFIFVHSWIPLNASSQAIDRSDSTSVIKFRENWRDLSRKDHAWEDATWGCPYFFKDKGLVPANKTIVCGHWSASDFHAHYEDSSIVNDKIYYSKDLIAIDACTARSGFCNVLVIDETGKCFDQYGNELKEN